MDNLSTAGDLYHILGQQHGLGGRIGAQDSDVPFNEMSLINGISQDLEVIGRVESSSSIDPLGNSMATL